MITIECRKCGSQVKGTIAETLAWDARHQCPEPPGAASQVTP